MLRNNRRWLNWPVILRRVKMYLLRNKSIRLIRPVFLQVKTYLLRNVLFGHNLQVIRWPVKTYLFSLLMTQNTHK